MKYTLAAVWLLAAAPLAVAQDEVTADEVPVSAESVPGADVPVGAEAVLDAVAEDAAAVETVPVDDGEEQAEAEPATPWLLYVGLDQVGTTLSISGLPPETPNQFDSGLYRLRAGMLLGQGVGVELQYGFKQSTDRPDQVNTDKYYGAYLVPTTNLFEMFELAFPVGYAMTTVEGTKFDSLAFGLSAALPLQYLVSSLPDLRLTLGWMTYYQKSDARLYGLNFGLRYDFSID